MCTCFSKTIDQVISVKNISLSTDQHVLNGNFLSRLSKIWSPFFRICRALQQDMFYSKGYKVHGLFPLNVRALAYCGLCKQRQNDLTLSSFIGRGSPDLRYIFGGLRLFCHILIHSSCHLSNMRFFNRSNSVYEAVHADGFPQLWLPFSLLSASSLPLTPVSTEELAIFN